MKRTAFALISSLVVLSLVAPVVAKDPDVIERYDATTVSMDIGKMVVVQIGVLEWSTAEQRAALVDAFNSGGSDAAMAYLKTQDEKAWVRFPNTNAYKMYYAYQFEQDGKRVVRMATQRPITHLEIAGQTRSLDNTVSIVDLQLDPETGKGKGTMVVGAELSRDEKTGHVTVGYRGIQPLQFTKVTQKKIKNKKE